MILRTVVWQTLLMFFGVAQAHEQPFLHHPDTTPPSVDCNKANPFLSYHLHTLFWPSNANSTAAAKNVHVAFLQQFPEASSCTFGPTNPAPEQTTPCVFEPDFAPAGPFLTGNFAYFLPVSYHEKIIAWFLQQKAQLLQPKLKLNLLADSQPTLDFFIHPNSGCSRQDHTHSALWGGQKWELDVGVLRT